MPALLLALALGVDPPALAEWLRKGDSRAERITGVAKSADVRLFFAQLDDDEPEEAVLRYDGDQKVEALVFDRTAAGWVVAGKFSDWWNYKPEYRDGFIELRAVTRAGRAELIVRTHSGGTEEDAIDIEIFQLRAGKLVAVLKGNEYTSKMEHPSGKVVTAVTRFEYPAAGVVVMRGAINCRAMRWAGEVFVESPCP